MVRKHHRHDATSITAWLPLVMARMRKYRRGGKPAGGARLWLSRLLDWLEGYAGESYTRSLDVPAIPTTSRRRGMSRPVDRDRTTARSTAVHQRIYLLRRQFARATTQLDRRTSKARFCIATGQPPTNQRSGIATSPPRSRKAHRGEEMANRHPPGTHQHRQRTCRSPSCTAATSLAYRDFLTSTGRMPGDLCTPCGITCRRGGTSFAGEADDLRRYPPSPNASLPPNWSTASDVRAPAFAGF